MIEAALDTSTNFICFSLRDKGKIVLEKMWQVDKGASEILSTLALYLTDYNYEFSNIQRWLVGIGPGSFTGLRVGIAFVQGLCYGNDTEILGINSGALLLEDTLQLSTTILHDGRRQEVLVNQFTYDTKWQQQAPYVLEIDKLSTLDTITNNIVTTMPQERFTQLPQEVLNKIKFVTINNCNSFFSKEVPKQQPIQHCLEPIYVRPAVFN